MGITDWKTIDMAMYTDLTSDEDEVWVYRMIVRNLGRCFWSSTRRMQQEVLRDEPKLTGTKWDALLGAVMEQLCLEEELRPPAWTEQPERFLAKMWRPLERISARKERHGWCPAPFLRRGVIVDPADFDLRNGTTKDWYPA